MAVFFKPTVSESDRLSVLAGATEGQLRRAIAKAECVDLYLKEKSARRGQALNLWVPRFIEWLEWRYPHLGVSRPTLYRWVQLYGSVLDLHRLIDRRGGNMIQKLEVTDGQTGKT